LQTSNKMQFSFQLIILDSIVDILVIETNYNQIVTFIEFVNAL